MSKIISALASKLRTSFILFTVFLCLGATAYFVTHLYLTTTSYETMLNWYASEAVALQEGNLLGAVTKIQRMKTSTDFIKGVLLLDQSLKKQGELIQFGKKIDQSIISKDLQQITVKDSGFFEQYVMMALPQDPNKVLVFNIQSTYLRNLFLALSFALFVLFIVFRFAILLNRNAEIRKRALLIKNSLGMLLSHGSSSEVLEKEHPELVSWWNEKKNEFDLAQASLAESKTQVLFAETAAKVAHDIRSPLGALVTTIENMDQNKKVDLSVLKFAAERLSSITEDLIKNRAHALPTTLPLKSDPGRTEHKALGNSLQLASTLRKLILEKECLYQHLSGISFKLHLPTLRYEATCFAPDAVARHLSNLIDNSVEAIPLKGEVALTLLTTNDDFIFELRDNGSGIPMAILDRFGELGNTSKSHGTGMGVHHAKKFVEDHGGKLHAVSESGTGTCVHFRLPLLKQKILTLKRDSAVAYLDDDSLAHYVWADFLKKQNVKATGFYKFEDYQVWAIHNPNHILFCDHDLKADKNGFEILEIIPQKAESFLVTNSFDDPDIISKAVTLGIPLIPKSQLHEHQVAWI